MPNDAKLGLLVGTVGVLLAAVMMGPKAPAVPPKPEDATRPAVIARAELPTAQTPGVPTLPRTKPELTGTPVKRTIEKNR